MREYDELFRVCVLYQVLVHYTVVYPRRRYPEALKVRLKTEFNRMDQNTITKATDTPTNWVNLLVFVEKPAPGKVSVCSGPKHLNEAIKRRYYHPTCTLDVTSKLAEWCNVF